MSRIVATFQAKCRDCSHVFDHPSLGEHAYGEVLLCSNNGLAYVWVSAFSVLPKKVASLMPNARAEDFWKIVAALADPVEGQKLGSGVHCTSCSSGVLEFWEGERLGSMEIAEGTFHAAEAWSPEELEQRVLGIGAPNPSFKRTPSGAA